MKMLKKILSITMIASLLSLCSAVSSFAAEKTTTITATPSATTVNVGDTFDVEFAIEGNPGITQIVLNLAQVDGLTIVSTEDICTVPGFDDNRNSTNLARNPFQLDLCNSDAEDATGDGKLYKVTYKAEKAGEYTIKITPDEVYDANDNDVVTTTNDVKVTVKSASEPKYFTATLPWCDKAAASSAVQFQFNNGTKDGTFDFELPTRVENAENVTVGLEVTEVPSDVTVKLNNVIWLAK